MAAIDFELVVSPTRGGPVELAEEAARSRFSSIIVAGGDGSVGDVAHGMGPAQQPAPLTSSPAPNLSLRCY